MGADGECVLVYWRARSVLCASEWVVIVWSKILFAEYVFLIL